MRAHTAIRSKLRLNHEHLRCDDHGNWQSDLDSGGLNSVHGCFVFLRVFFRLINYPTINIHISVLIVNLKLSFIWIRTNHHNFLHQIVEEDFPVIFAANRNWPEVMLFTSYSVHFLFLFSKPMVDWVETGLHCFLARLDCSFFQRINDSRIFS